MKDKNIEKVRAFAIGHTKMGKESIHGIDHWDRVARNGEALHVPDADMEVVLSFAICMTLRGNPMTTMSSMAQGQLS